MGRKKSAVARGIVSDVVYGSYEIQKFINTAMLCGKKAISEKIVYQALDSFSTTLKGNPKELFDEVLGILRPVAEVRSMRVGGATYQVPVDVNDRRALALTLRWIIGAARQRGERTMADRLSSELLDAYNKKGAAYKKKETVHSMAEANKLFAHYKWGSKSAQ